VSTTFNMSQKLAAVHGVVASLVDKSVLTPLPYPSFRRSQGKGTLAFMTVSVDGFLYRVIRALMPCGPSNAFQPFHFVSCGYRLASSW
jgi:hypothetical protein